MVYIVDDDKYVRKGFQILLQSADINSEAYESGEEFLNAYKPTEKEALVLDIQMPGFSGIDLLEQMEKNNIYLPVIIVTAFDDPNIRESARKYGAIAYFRKPLDGNALIDLLKYSVLYQG
jgi:FixJ family two-component response regulator